MSQLVVVLYGAVASTVPFPVCLVVAREVVEVILLPLVVGLEGEVGGVKDGYYETVEAVYSSPPHLFHCCSGQGTHLAPGDPLFVFGADQLALC
jgi:hypothetical protein